MKDGELSDRVERLATRFMCQHSVVGDRRHETVVDEGTDELSRGRLVDIRRRHPGRIVVLGDEFGFESFVIGCCIVACIWTSHGTSPSGMHVRRAAPLVAPID